MAYSFWKDPRGYISVSVNATLPGPVAGYLIPLENGNWSIEGDETETIYTSREQAQRNYSAITSPEYSN